MNRPPVFRTPPSSKVHRRFTFYTLFILIPSLMSKLTKMTLVRPWSWCHPLVRDWLTYNKQTRSNMSALACNWNRPVWKYIRHLATHVCQCRHVLSCLFIRGQSVSQSNVEAMVKIWILHGYGVMQNHLKQDQNSTLRCSFRGLRIYKCFNLFSLPILVTFQFEWHFNLSDVTSFENKTILRESTFKPSGSFKNKQIFYLVFFV